MQRDGRCPPRGDEVNRAAIAGINRRIIENARNRIAIGPRGEGEPGDVVVNDHSPGRQTGGIEVNREQLGASSSAGAGDIQTAGENNPGAIRRPLGCFNAGELGADRKCRGTVTVVVARGAHVQHPQGGTGAGFKRIRKCATRSREGQPSLVR